jgi:hypothetical protein
MGDGEIVINAISTRDGMRLKTIMMGLGFVRRMEDGVRKGREAGRRGLRGQ